MSKHRASGGILEFEDPGRPLTEEIVRLTGITDAEIAGRSINAARVESALEAVALVIANNAGFGGPFIERRLPACGRKAWACSIRDVPWTTEGFSSAKLEFLLYKHCELFCQGQRADLDCAATLHVLTTRFGSGHTPLHHLLEAARKRTVRIWACHTSYAAKDLLKQRKYRWNDGEDGRPRAWFRDVPEVLEPTELQWLEDTIYCSKPPTAVRESFNTFRRYSEGF